MGTFNVHVVQMKKLKHRKVEWFAQGHTASQWQSQDSNSVLIDRKGIQDLCSQRGCGQQGEERTPFITFLRQAFLGEGNGSLRQYSCLENSMDRGAWQATVHWAAKESDTTLWLKQQYVLLKFEKKLILRPDPSPALCVVLNRAYELSESHFLFWKH